MQNILRWANCTYIHQTTYSQNSILLSVKKKKKVCVHVHALQDLLWLQVTESLRPCGSCKSC